MPVNVHSQPRPNRRVPRFLTSALDSTFMSTTASNIEFSKNGLLRAARDTLLDHGEVICGVKLDRAMCDLHLVGTAVIATLSLIYASIQRLLI